MNKMYKISESELKSLLADSLRLTALENGGVDNWSWYSESCSDFIDSFIKEHEIDDEDFYYRDAAEFLLKNYEVAK